MSDTCKCGSNKHYDCGRSDDEHEIVRLRAEVASLQGTNMKMAQDAVAIDKSNEALKAELKRWKDCEYESQVAALKADLAEANRQNLHHESLYQMTLDVVDSLKAEIASLKEGMAHDVQCLGEAVAEVAALKAQNQKIAEMRIADCERAEAAEAKLAEALGRIRSLEGI